MSDREFETFEPVPALLGIVGALAVALGIACTSLQPADAGATAACVNPTPGQAGCVLPLLAQNLAHWDVALDDAKKACGVSPEVSRAIWASHTQAEVLEGFVPRAIGSDGGIRP
jgi:hypothetical protein